MTKQQRKEIYWAAMFEIVAFGGGLWMTLDFLLEKIATDRMVPEISQVSYEYIGIDRLSAAIDLCEQ